MTSGQFREALERIRWSQAQIAAELGEEPLRIRKMATGRMSIPDPLAVWIRALAADLEAARLRNPPPVLPSAAAERRISASLSAPA
jgi:transcriptional regulator with XRE-family HTH domain